MDSGIVKKGCTGNSERGCFRAIPVALLAAGLFFLPSVTFSLGVEPGGYLHTGSACLPVASGSLPVSDKRSLVLNNPVMDQTARPPCTE